MIQPMMTEEQLLQLASKRLVYFKDLRAAEQVLAKKLVEEGKLVRRQPSRKIYYTLPK